MRRFLLLLSILCSVFISKVQAQEPRLTAPKNVCLNGYATMHAFLTSGTEDLVNWEITYPDGTVLDHRITWQDNYPDDHHPDFRYMSPGAGQSVTFEVRQVGTYTVTIRIRRDGNWSEERTKTFTSYDCTMDECEGTFTPATNFKETFGTFYSGAPRRQVEAPATITYNFLASGELADDQYSIYYSARLGGKAQWDNVFDHTDNGYGGMLIANSSNTPKLFYRRPVNNLCPGAKYNFSAWFINLNSLEVLNNVCQTEDYRYAGVTFIVRNASDNSIIKQFNTYDVSMDLSRNLSGDHRLTGWQQFGGTVTLAPGEENVIVEIMNNNPGGCGNDVAVDDIEFVFCAPKIYSYIDGLGVDNDMVCPGAELTITSKIEPADYFEDPVYVWEMNKNGAGWGPITEPGYTYPNGDSILHIGPGVLQELDYIQYRLYVFERNNVNTRGCYTPGNMVTISVPELPTIIASRPRICRGDTTTLTATPLEGPGITGYETFEFTGPNILTWPTLPAPKDKVMVTPVVTSTYEVTGSILYGQYGNGQPRVCQKEANITIEVDQPPTVNVGPDQRVCVNEPITLDAGAANAVYPILWQPTNATTQTITVNAPGVSSTQAYRVTVTNGECKVSDTVNITAVAYPEATIVSQAAFCNTSPIPLVAVEPDPGYSGEWTIVGDDHGASIDDPTSYDNALLLNMPFDQPVTVRWTVTADGTDCSDYAEQDIIRESRPVSTPGPNQTSCTNVFTLAANAPANATMQGTWSVSGAGSVTFGDIHDPNTTATITSGVGIVTLAWTMAKLNSPSACGPDTKTMTIRYVDPPTLTINSTDISSCRGAGGFYRFEIPYTQTNAQVFDLEAVGPNPLPGFSNITNSAFVTPLRITYPASTPAGTYTFRMVARRTNLATCEVETFFSVRIETPSTLSSVSSNENTICIGNSATLTVTGTLGSNAQWVWYEGGCGSGTSIGSGASITVSPTSSTTYYVRAEGGGPCANTACGSVSVTVNQRPAFPDAGVDQENCNNPLFVLDAETPNVGTGRWTLPPGVTFVSGSILNPKSTVSVPVGQTVALGWTVVLGKCVVGPDTVLLTNLAPIINNVIEEDQLICSGDQPEEITAVGTPTGGNGSYTYQWQRSTTSATSGFMNIGSATGINYQPPALTQTTWYRRVVTSGACTSNSNAVEITVSTAVPNIVSTPPDTSVQCYTGTDYTIYFGTPQFDHPEGLAIDVTYADVVTPAACGQTITRTWTATDACNKTTTTSQTITVIDTIKPWPVGPTPADTTVSCDAVPDPVTFPVSDNCSADADVDTVFTETRINVTCANTYELLREWTLTDECGNDTVISQRIYVIDTTHPVVVGPAPADTTVSCDAVPDPATFQVSDNCSVEANIDTSFVETRTNG
ncbi:Ig-like domain-containing protein, partial [Chitinophaga cymbidii]